MKNVYIVSTFDRGCREMVIVERMVCCLRLLELTFSDDMGGRLKIHNRILSNQTPANLYEEKNV